MASCRIQTTHEPRANRYGWPPQEGWLARAFMDLGALGVSCAMPMDLIQIRTARVSLPRTAGTADTLVAALFGTPVLSAKSAA